MSKKETICDSLNYYMVDDGLSADDVDWAGTLYGRVATSWESFCGLTDQVTVDEWRTYTARREPLCVVFRDGSWLQWDEFLGDWERVFPPKKSLKSLPLDSVFGVRYD